MAVDFTKFAAIKCESYLRDQENHTHFFKINCSRSNQDKNLVRRNRAKANRFQIIPVVALYTLPLSFAYYFKHTFSTFNFLRYVKFPLKNWIRNQIVLLDINVV